jgi:4-methyl-5(b-hydroxyethyl)-thiazole monophosphate biosynthesis
MPHAVTVLADGFEEVEAIAIIDILRRAGVEVTVLGLDGFEVRGAHNLRVKADMPFAEFIGDFDAVVLPGGMPGTSNLAASAPLLELVKNAYDRGKLCAAICAAPIVLAKAGILDSRKAACYPGCEAALSGAGALVVEDDVVVDGNVITSRAVGTAISFALELAEAMVGEETATKVGAAILY